MDVGFRAGLGGNLWLDCDGRIQEKFHSLCGCAAEAGQDSSQGATAVLACQVMLSIVFILRYGQCGRRCRAAHIIRGRGAG